VIVVFGIDFTSTPNLKKSITCLSCVLEDGTLRAGQLREWQNFGDFERALSKAGPWIAGIDFPFGQSRKFVQNIGWPLKWAEYVIHARSLGRTGFCDALTNYRAARSYGDREHRRKTDIASGSISPQKLHGVPVALMFFEGAPRLIDAGVTIPLLQIGDPNRIVVEAYPGIIARRFIGRQSYKNDRKDKQSEDQRKARLELLHKLLAGSLPDYGFVLEAPLSLADDPTGDRLDALLCAVQAAWAWTQRENQFGASNAVDPLEGWIADPASTEPHASRQALSGS
jgi:hypothetical protein